MAARKKPFLAQSTRDKIKASMIVNRLQDHIVGTVELSTSQVRAAEVLLRKVCPDLQAVEMKAEVTQSPAVIADQPMDASAWEQQYAASMEPTAGATESTH